MRHSVRHMELHEMMAKAGVSVVEVARNVKPDQLTAPTPCPDWDVRALINHLMFWSAFRSELAARKASEALHADRRA